MSSISSVPSCSTDRNNDIMTRTPDCGKLPSGVTSQAVHSINLPGGGRPDGDNIKPWDKELVDFFGRDILESRAETRTCAPSVRETSSTALCMHNGTGVVEHGSLEPGMGQHRSDGLGSGLSDTNEGETPPMNHPPGQTPASIADTSLENGWVVVDTPQGQK
ncbi:hypothetical protein TREMEDRAFT_62962 [Tremella mesenterica DSM 1558]|uniref:uncharacterized protein n=1 Tax=Tremella mesenterica (strain ATCC 24925 / CBS 8224 / DSM 1558 / NBRC 9311 / NRRL Y-6157 / RJB 2259-6 / UBC 559-6) TaxID=578456 RepID=UPI0003F49224|nr:uncharacterized protein TREMEDRAFT_62962 [Tremella mesenterica DSM 1558]EIW69230.1 hypothetical protein TREMEDRAFT_62962 [Tremella mesenterica DSM 1558]